MPVTWTSHEGTTTNIKSDDSVVGKRDGYDVAGCTRFYQSFCDKTVIYSACYKRILFRPSVLFFSFMETSPHITQTQGVNRLIQSVNFSFTVWSTRYDIQILVNYCIHVTE
ncbi:hypothetical protein BaRGS_00026324 [Batillaria attramentaria]|uniref:Uncharacterized protein n=1 Tax=Batillaria attramentaria TaxID=370345 RepID=A0ABD0K6G8_9CAEN